MLQPGLVLSKLDQGQELDLDKGGPQAGASPGELRDGWHGARPGWWHRGDPPARAPRVLVPLPSWGVIFRFPEARFLPSLPACSRSPGATPP